MVKQVFGKYNFLKITYANSIIQPSHFSLFLNVHFLDKLQSKTAKRIQNEK